MHNFIGDIAFMSAETLTGKNIPLLLAVCKLPLDPYLMGIMVVAGTATGSIGTMILTKTQFRQDYVVYQWALRFLNQAFACFLSVWLFMRVAPLFLEEGFGLCIMPLFVVVLQYLRETPTTPFILFLLCFVCGSASFYLERPPPVYVDEPVLKSQPHTVSRTLQALSRQDWYYHQRHRHEHLEQPISHGLFYSILIFFCSFYASTQHNTTRPEIYVSSAFVYNIFYGGWILFTSAMIQIYAVMWIGLTHDTTLHLAYAGDLPKQTGLVCVWLLCVCLLYSATWNFTQISEQIFTMGVEDRLDVRMRFTAGVISAAIWWQTRATLPILAVIMAITNIGTWMVAQFVY